jgi:hypothetical protein
LLSQWRGYASGDGYAIGFHSEALLSPAPLETEYRIAGQHELVEELVSGSQVQPSLVQIQYGDSAVASMIDHVLREIAPQPTGHPGSRGWMQAVSLAVPALAGIKHSAFTEEQEWRLFVGRMTARLRESFRISSYGIVPYVKLPIDLHKALYEIVVGPGGHSDSRVTGVARLLHSLNLDNVIVRVSSIPFRG